MKPPLPICTLSALAACTLSGQGGTQVYGEIKARDLCVTAPILLSAFCFLSCLLSLSQAFLQARLHVGKHCTLSAFFSCCGWWFRLALYALH
ncbi:TPA: hypothetical protein ACJL0L_001706 [Neisseria meningitidis]|uniref:hypothetical protein n=1 Tax=Neisseria meningitidis TaxID=487 RepID=UPI000E1D912A|nr:hypothetical protein [Neisseria meningitidis]